MRSAGGCAVFAAVWLGLAAAAGTALYARDAASPPASTASSQSLPLEYREVGHRILSAGLDFSPQTAPFAKEPALGQRSLQRGTFKFGHDADQFLPFIWDYAKGKLYLDLNRDGDLSNDPAGTFSSAEARLGFSRNYYYQTFTNVHLAFKTPAGILTALVDLQLYNYNGRTGGSVHCRSFREGKLSINGKDWQVGFIQDVAGKPGSTDNGYLLLRPWELRQRDFAVGDGSLAAFAFCRNLFFDHQGYSVSFTCVKQGDSPACKLEFREQAPELGELKLTGKFIRRMVLTARQANSPYTVVLDTPGTVVKVPVGSYGVPEVHLQAGSAEAHREPSRFGESEPATAVVVSATGSASLSAGGPLTNTVAVNRHGWELSFDYRLIGARGETYALYGERKPPGFAVYKGDKQLASGKFEFG